MTDLFDVKSPGVGFHLTSHMIAIAALFVACFAITGYITFRDNSIGPEKLKEGADDYVVTELVMPMPVRAAAAATGVASGTVTQPANTRIIAITGVCTAAYTEANAAITQFAVGTTAGNGEIVAAAELGADGGGGGAQTVPVNADMTTMAFTGPGTTAGALYSPVERTLFFSRSYAAAANITAGGSITWQVTFGKW